MKEKGKVVPQAYVLGWGYRVKVLKIGEVIKGRAKRIELCKRIGITIPHIQYKIPDRPSGNRIVYGDHSGFVLYFLKVLKFYEASTLVLF